MPSTTKRTLKPELPLGIALGAAGTAKLAGAQFTKDNFKRWGYADPWRPAIGVIEVATAATALGALKFPTLGKLAALGTLSTMGGAIATHLMAKEPAYNLIPPFVVASLGAAVLLGVSIVDEPDVEAIVTAAGISPEVLVQAQ